MDNTPAINKLNHDALSYIFSLNANMFVDSDALTMTRHTSQVCKYWRDSMLTNASLWAKLLDFNSLEDSSIDWGEELVRRSGCSPLWIKVNFWKTVSETLLQFFANVVDGNWQRIANLALTVPPRILLESMHPLPLTFQRPAPYLEAFRFNLSDIDDGWTLPKELLLPFTDEAPKLREYGTNGCTFSTQSPWLHQLRYLEIGTTSLTLADIFTAVELCACDLVDLVVGPKKIVKSLDSNSTTSFPTLHLPKLQRLKLSLASPELPCILLEHLMIPPSCSLDFTFPPIMFEEYSELEDALTVDDLCEEKVEPLIKSVAKHAQRFFKSHPPGVLRIFNFPREILLEDHSRPATNPYFRFSMSAIGPSIPSHIFELLLQEFEFPELASVKHLRLSVYDNDTYSDLETYFSDFFVCLQGLEVLEIENDRPLEHLAHFKSDKNDLGDGGMPLLDANNIVFPLLKTVKLYGFIGGAEGLHNFIQHRQSIEKPIAVIDIAVEVLSSIPNLSFLEGFEGLEVYSSEHSIFKDTSKRHKYVCGSGSPEKLVFNQETQY